MIEKNPRIIIQQVGVISGGKEIQVELGYEGNSYKGISITDKDEQAQMLAAIKALIMAVNSIIPTPIVTRVSEVKMVNFQDIPDPVIVTVLGIKLRGIETLFPGTAKQQGSTLLSAVRAALDAINRPIGLVL